MNGLGTKHIKTYMAEPKIIKRNEIMVFYSEKEQLYLETDTSGVGIGESLQQVRDVMQFPRNEAPHNAVL